MPLSKNVGFCRNPASLCGIERKNWYTKNPRKQENLIPSPFPKVEINQTRHTRVESHYPRGTLLADSPFKLSFTGKALQRNSCPYLGIFRVKAPTSSQVLAPSPPPISTHKIANYRTPQSLITTSATGFPRIEKRLLISCTAFIPLVTRPNATE